MSDKEIKQENLEIENTSQSNKKNKSFLDTVREVNERERREEIEKEAQLSAARAEKERAEREAYTKKLYDEKIELIKLKTGVISDEDIPKEELVEKNYTFKEKFSNFVYHYKWTVLVTMFICALVGFFIYDMATKVDPDVSVMILATDPEFTYLTEKISEVLEQYCGDYNGDGKVSVRVAYLPAVVDEDNWQELYVSQADQTKLVAEFQSEDSIIVIADEESCEFTKINQGTLADMTTVFPNNENATALGYMLSGTNFASDIEYPNLADNLFIGFRKPVDAVGVNSKKFQNNYDNAIDMWTNYVNGNAINPVVTETE